MALLREYRPNYGGNMEKRMHNVEVAISQGGFIMISQDEDFRDTNIISIHPDQVDILINWLTETRDEIRRLVLEGVSFEEGNQ